MYGLTGLGFLPWLTYGILLWQWPLIFTNGICLNPAIKQRLRS
jgi:MtN3 and saliva related transmembrane protein